MGTRLKEHQKDVAIKEQKSVVAKHSVYNKHEFDFNNIKILDTEKNWQSRCFSEMLHIHYNSNTINKIQDTHFLKNTYKNFLNNLKKVFWILIISTYIVVNIILQ